MILCRFFTTSDPFHVQVVIWSTVDIKILIIVWRWAWLAFSWRRAKGLGMAHENSARWVDWHSWWLLFNQDLSLNAVACWTSAPNTHTHTLTRTESHASDQMLFCTEAELLFSVLERLTHAPGKLGTRGAQYRSHLFMLRSVCVCVCATRRIKWGVYKWANCRGCGFYTERTHGRASYSIF